MSSSKQNMVEYTQPSNKKYGTSNYANMQKAFVNAPQYNDYKDASVKKIYEDLLNNLGPDINEANGYYGIVGYSLNYADNNPPNLEDVETGGGGLPATPYSPNIVSPGPGSTDASAQQAYTGETKNIDSISNFGSGLGGLVSPSETSVNLSQTTLGSYISGRSYQGSNGNS